MTPGKLPLLHGDGSKKKRTYASEPSISLVQCPATSTRRERPSCSLDSTSSVQFSCSGQSAPSSEPSAFSVSTTGEAEPKSARHVPGKSAGSVPYAILPSAHPASASPTARSTVIRGSFELTICSPRLRLRPGSSRRTALTRWAAYPTSHPQRYAARLSIAAWSRSSKRRPPLLYLSRGSHLRPHVEISDREKTPATSTPPRGRNTASAASRAAFPELRISPLSSHRQTSVVTMPRTLPA